MTRLDKVPITIMDLSVCSDKGQEGVKVFMTAFKYWGPIICISHNNNVYIYACKPWQQQI
jgi:hypothetical protein